MLSVVPPLRNSNIKGQELGLRLLSRCRETVGVTIQEPRRHREAFISYLRPRHTTSQCVQRTQNIIDMPS